MCPGWRFSLNFTKGNFWLEAKRCTLKMGPKGAAANFCVRKYKLLGLAISKFNTTQPTNVCTFRVEMTSQSTSGRQQIAHTCQFWATLLSWFLYNSSTDFEKVYCFVNNGSSTAFAILLLTEHIFASWPWNWGPKGCTMVSVLHMWLISIF